MGLYQQDSIIKLDLSVPLNEPEQPEQPPLPLAHEEDLQIQAKVSSPWRTLEYWKYTV